MKKDEVHPAFSLIDSASITINPGSSGQWLLNWCRHVVFNDNNFRDKTHKQRAADDGTPRPRTSQRTLRYHDSTGWVHCSSAGLHSAPGSPCLEAPATSHKQCATVQPISINSDQPHRPAGPDCWTKLNVNQNQHSSLRTGHMCVRIIVHNCRTEHSTERFS